MHCGGAGTCQHYINPGSIDVMQVLVWYTSVVEQVTWQQGVWEKSSTRSGEKIPSTDLWKM